MYKVLLADDEKVILHGISTLVDWESLHTQLVGTALNGEIAYEMIVQDPPDIVISDIKMPGMNGLELIRKVKLSYPNIRFIILSGYEEFEFAKQAMAYGVKHYLLKPSNDRKISSVIEEVVRELDEARRRDTFIQQTKHDLEKVMPQVKEQFLKEFITNKAYGTKEWDYYAQLFHLRQYENEMRLLLFEIEGVHDYEYVFALQNIAIEIISEEQEIILGTTSGDRVVILIEGKSLEPLFELLQKIQHIYSQYYHLEVTVAVSELGEISMLRKLYKQSLECLTHRFFLGEGSIITSQDIWSGAKKREEIQFDHEQLVYAIMSGHTDKVEQYLRQFFEQMKQWKYDIDLVKFYTLELYMIIIKNSESMEVYFKQVVELQGLETLDQIERFIICTAREVAQTVYESFNRIRSGIIRQVIEYIHLHLEDETMTLSKLANDILYMNADYLGRLFKKETGERVTTYIVNVRMEKAKQLIVDSREVKVFEIAEKVGFGNNPQYFSKVFKKHTGFAPSDYKKTVSP